ncbi:TPA_asm: hemolysin expression modulator Hha [Salmonella enterica]|uniref:Hemolysin expression modulator Hha n=2 Tax=Enterobacteriaceae TaxID=543 RepID=A0A723UFF1_SALER|nr:hemolysin expression modulator Hha [Salmonella enterica]
MAKTKQEWLYQLRRCSSLKTLEKIIAKNQGTLASDKIEAFNSAVDHRLAELTMNKLYDKVPASVWTACKITPTKIAGNPTPALIHE